MSRLIRSRASHSKGLPQDYEYTQFFHFFSIEIAHLRSMAVLPVACFVHIQWKQHSAAGLRDFLKDRAGFPDNNGAPLRGMPSGYGHIQKGCAA